MRAIGVTQYGGPQALHELDVPAEPLGADQVRVRVLATAVNPADAGVRKGLSTGGAVGPPPPGEVPGMDLAGTITEVADGAGTDLRVGERVMAVVAPDGAHGAYREEVVLPAASVARVPAGASDVEAATLPMNGLTALLALEELGLQVGQVLAITGAAGVLGGYLVQLATADGLVVVADAKGSDVDLVRSLGADHIVVRGEGFAGAVRELFPGGVDALIDTALLAKTALPAVKGGGAVATVLGWTGDDEAKARGVRFEPVSVFRAIERADLLDRLRRSVEEGTLTLRVGDVLPAEEAVQAHERMDAGGVRGRLVLDWTN